MAQTGSSLPPIKVIFLDIDGVICCNAYGRLEESKLETLKHIVSKTGARVVLSTDWRRVPQLKAQVISTLKLYGITTIGATPCRPNWLAVRPEEITAWLKGYASASNASEKPSISHWVAIDDRPLLQEQGGDELRGHFVRTKLAIGLTDRLAQRVIDILMGYDSEAATTSPTAVPAPSSYPYTSSAGPSASQRDAPSYMQPKIGTRVADLTPSTRSALPSSGFATPPPSSPGDAAEAEAKASAARAYALGRGPAPALSPGTALNLKRGSVNTPPRLTTGIANGRSPVHVSSGNAQWWNGSSPSSRAPAGLHSAAPARLSSPVTTYGVAAAGAGRSRYAH